MVCRDHGNEATGSIKCIHFLNLYVCQLCKKDCAIVLVIHKFLKSLLLILASPTLLTHLLCTV